MSTLKKVIILSGSLIVIGGGVFHFQRSHQDKIDYDCSDFSTQQDAQNYFVAQGGSSKKNIDDLDANHNGIACESNPTTAPFSFLKNIDPNSQPNPNEPTIGDISNGAKYYTNPACLTDGKFDLNKAIQINGECFSYQPY